MKQVRKNVFETNSSSTHSLVISEVNEHSYEISPSLRYGEYGWAYDVLDTPTKKSEYLLTLVQYQDSVRDGFPEHVPYPKGNSFSEREEYDSKVEQRNKQILKVLKEHKYTKWILKSLEEESGLKINIRNSSDGWHPLGYIDHQSLEPDIFYKNGIHLFDMNEKDFKKQVKEIVFNKSYVIHVDNDNH